MGGKGSAPSETLALVTLLSSIDDSLQCGRRPLKSLDATGQGPRKTQQVLARPSPVGANPLPALMLALPPPSPTSLCARRVLSPVPALAPGPQGALTPTSPVNEETGTDCDFVSQVVHF